MMKMDDFLDKKHGKFIGRIYLLVILFIGNLLIPAGAALRYLHNGSPLVLYLGLFITTVAIAILSKPYNLNNYTPENELKKI